MCTSQYLGKLDEAHLRLVLELVFTVSKLAEQSPNGKSVPEEITNMAITFGPLMFRGNSAHLFLSRYLFQAMVENFEAIFGPYSQMNALAHV